MEEILDRPLIQINENSVRYGGFWPRLGALIIDALIMTPVSLGLHYLNISSWKSSIIFALLTLVTLVYKPVMESVYGATLGKMCFDLKVVNMKFESATVKEVLLRNVFHLTPSLISLFFTLSLFQLPEFESVNSLSDYTSLTSASSFLQAINLLSGLIFIVDAIVLLSDDRNRSLHDKIGGTCVIGKNHAG